jgi:hypothetical protein
VISKILEGISGEGKRIPPSRWKISDDLNSVGRIFYHLSTGKPYRVRSGSDSIPVTKNFLLDKIMTFCLDKSTAKNRNWADQLIAIIEDKVSRDKGL